MLAKVEPSGCYVHKGKVQIRISMYLDPTDPRYNEHHVYVPDGISPEYLEGYKGALDGFGLPLDIDAYNSWIDGLPHIWQNNPFHNHFIFVDANIADSKIRELLQEILGEFFAVWSRSEDISEYWRQKPNKPKFVAGDMSAKNIKLCEAKVTDIINKASLLEAASL